MQAFVEDLALSDFEHVADGDGELWSQYSVRSQPAFVFINDDGTSETIVSALGEEQLTAKIEDLIAN